VLSKLLTQFVKRFVLDDPATCSHEWVVYSTATRQVCLELHCRRCALTGAVMDPTEEEWAKAFHAPSKPYWWTQPERVIPGSGQII
jgi:hypothetical protein